MNYTFTEEEFNDCKKLTEDTFCLCSVLHKCYNGHEDEMPIDMVLPIIRLIGVFVDRVNDIFICKSANPLVVESAEDDL